VESVEVDYTAKTCTVMAEPGADTAAMIEALKDANYGASLK